MRKVKFNVVKAKNIGTGATTDIPAIKGEGINYDAEIDQLADEIENLNNIKANQSDLEDNYYDKDFFADISTLEIKDDRTTKKLLEESDIPNIVKVSNSYSTEEIVIGTWIGNKPLYRKTISVGNVTIGGNSEKNVAHNISNIDKVLTITMRVEQNWDNRVSNNTNTRCALCDNTNIILRNSDNNSNTWNDVFVTLEYTKTTD